MDESTEFPGGECARVCTPTRAKEISAVTIVRQEAFLDAYGKHGNVEAAAQVAGIHRNTHYRWIKEENDPGGEYKERFETATGQFADRVRHEITRRAIQGDKEPVMYQGQQCRDDAGNLLYLAKKSDRLLELLARAACPEFREKREVAAAPETIVKPQIRIVRYPARMT